MHVQGPIINAQIIRIKSKFLSPMSVFHWITCANFYSHRHEDNQSKEDYHA